MLVPSVIPGRRGFASGPHPVAGANHRPNGVVKVRARHWKLGSATIGGSAIIAMAALGAVFGNLGSAGPEKALSSVAPQATELGESHRDRKHAIGFRAGTLARRRRPITFHNHRGSRGTWRHAHERYRSAGSLPCRHVTVRMASHVRHRSQAACFEVPGT